MKGSTSCRFKIGDVVRCNPSTWRTPEYLKYRLTIIGIRGNQVATKWPDEEDSNNFDENYLWEGEYILSEESIIDKLLEKYK